MHWETELKQHGKVMEFHFHFPDMHSSWNLEQTAIFLHVTKTTTDYNQCPITS